MVPPGRGRKPGTLPGFLLSTFRPQIKPAMLTEFHTALPDNSSELVGAVLSIVLAIIAAFRRGKKQGRKEAA